MGNHIPKRKPGPNAHAIFQTMLMSDLHLESSQQTVPEFTAVAPILILAGDIGHPDDPSLKKFLLAQCRRFEHVFYVAGNHCFHGGEYHARLAQLHGLNKLSLRLHFLHNESYLLPYNVRILGTTLWSHIPSEKAAAVGSVLNDYQNIWIADQQDKSTRRQITVADTNAWHAEQHAWLRQEIRRARKNREHVVVITHHAPTRRGILPERQFDLDVDDAFVNDHDSDCIDPVRLWVYGHTHASTDLLIHSTRVVSNQLGYDQENSGFRPNLRMTLYDDGAVSVREPLVL